MNTLLKSWTFGLLSLAVTVAFGARPACAADAVKVDAAKAEGSVVWYSSTPIGQANKIIKLFQDKYGIKVQLFRSGGSEVMRRFMMESQAGMFATDVLTTSDPEAIAALADKGMFVAFRPAGSDKIPASLKDPDGRFTAQRLNVVAFYGKDGLTPPVAMPKTWQDLTKPEYKGKVVITDPSFTVLQLYVVAMISKEFGWDYYEKLNKNDVMIVKGGQQTFDMVKRGERAISGGTDMSYANAAKMQGAPMSIGFPTDGAFIVPAPSAVVKGSPHPEAAKLFAEFLISKEAQVVFPESGNYAARTDVPPPPSSPSLADIKIKTIDYAYVNKVSADVKKHFNEIFQ